MNPNRCRIALRPRNPIDVFDLVIVFLRARWKPLLVGIAVVVLPAWLMLGALAAWLEGSWWTMLLAILVGPVLQVPFTVLGGRLLFEDKVRFRDVVWDVLVSVPRLIVVVLVALIGWVLSAFTLFYATPFVQAFLLYLPEAAMLERVPPRRGVRRSWRLAGGHFLVALIGATARWLIVGWFVLLGEMLGQTLVGFLLQLGQPFGALESGSVTPFMIGGVLLAQPLFALYRLFLYVDVRTRVEGWDLQVALAALRVAARGGP